MNARVGDELLLQLPGEAFPVGGKIVAIAHPDGLPPYAVRWEDGRESLMFPGADARLRRRAPARV